MPLNNVLPLLAVQSRYAQHTARRTFLAARESFRNCRVELQKPDFGKLIVIPEFLPDYNEIDFCGLRQIYVDQFVSSNFLSCAGLI